MGTPLALKGLEYLGDQRDPEDKPESVGPEWVEKYGHLVPGTLGTALLPMRYAMTLAKLFGRGRPNPKITSMRGVVNQINSALAQGPNHGLIPPVNIFGKGNVGNPLSSIISKFAIPGKRYPDDIINKKVNYALNKTDEAQREFTSLLTKGGIQRTDELVGAELSRILRDTNKTGLIRRGDVKAQFTGKKFKFGNMTVERLRESLKNEIIPRQPGRGGISQIGGMQSENITEAFTKALGYAFETKMGEQDPEPTQEQPPAQEPPTQERSLAENAFNAFKNIGIGSAITRNVFNPKRLSRPDLGFGFQKLFSRQY
jgi:hypothetical protein